MASTAVPDDLAFEMLEKMQADLHIEMDRAKAAEAELDKLKKLLAAAQKQLDDPEMVATQVAIDAAGQDGDPFDHCNVCGIDRGDHDCVEGEEPGTCYLVPCEEHLIPVEGAGAVEVSVQTDDGAAEDPDDLAAAQTVERLMKEAADAEAERDEALEKLAAEPDHNENILAAIRAGWIIPNYFEQEHFDEMEGWDQDRLEQFQSFLECVVCGGDDFVRQGIQEALEVFIEEHPCSARGCDEPGTNGMSPEPDGSFEYYYCDRCYEAGAIGECAGCGMEMHEEWDTYSFRAGTFCRPCGREHEETSSDEEAE